jgi:hypothetical protein
MNSPAVSKARKNQSIDTRRYRKNSHIGQSTLRKVVGRILLPAVRLAFSLIFILFGDSRKTNYDAD